MATAWPTIVIPAQAGIHDLLSDHWLKIPDRVADDPLAHHRHSRESGNLLFEINGLSEVRRFPLARE
jgi:hypothetical protein